MLTRTSGYALRALLLLSQEPGRQRFAAELAAELAISASFLSKLLGHLRRRGLLVSKKGSRGGFQLAVPPEEITVRAVVREFQDAGHPRGCLLGQASCDDETACPLHEQWTRISTLYDEMLDGTSLAGLAAFETSRATTNAGGGAVRRLKET